MLAQNSILAQTPKTQRTMKKACELAAQAIKNLDDLLAKIKPNHQFKSAPAKETTLNEWQQILVLLNRLSFEEKTTLHNAKLLLDAARQYSQNLYNTLNDLNHKFELNDCNLNVKIEIIFFSDLYNKHQEIIQQLKNIDGILYSYLDNAFSLAQRGHWPLVKKMLNENRISLETIDSDGKTLSDYAIEQKNIPALHDLWPTIANKSKLTPDQKTNWIRAFNAAIKQKWKYVLTLIDLDTVPVNAFAQPGIGFAHYAIQQSNIQVLNALKARGHLKPLNVNEIAFALALKNKWEIPLGLVEIGWIDINQTESEEDNLTLLDYAQGYNNKAVATTLMIKGAVSSFQDSDSDTDSDDENQHYDALIKAFNTTLSKFSTMPDETPLEPSDKLMLSQYPQVTEDDNFLISKIEMIEQSSTTKKKILN